MAVGTREEDLSQAAVSGLKPVGHLSNRGAVFQSGSNDLYAGPLFVDPDRGDYHLRPDSPARNHGRSLGIRGDFDGRLRPADRPDVGAFQRTGARTQGETNTEEELRSH